MKSIYAIYLTGLLVVSLLTACGGGGSSTSSTNNADSGALQTAGGDIQISGAGIKGPLAFADTKIFLLDTSFPEFYDSNSPISFAITDQYAQISNLTVPGDIQPPFILVIGGEYTVDLNTDKPPVISKLITVITKEMLEGKQPIYATPLTTLAYHMARNKNSVEDDSNRFITRLKRASREVSRLLAIDQNHVIDIFESPLVINDATDTFAKQEEAVYHRAALEAFAAKIYRLSLRAQIPTDTIIELVALDIESDGVIDNTANGTEIGGIDPEIMGKDPKKLIIPNTTHRIEDTITLMEEERAAIGTGNGPELLVDTIDFNNPAPAPVPVPDPEPTPVTEPIVTLSASSIDFGDVNVGDISDISTVTLTNSGSAPLTITGVSVSDGFIRSDDCNNFLPAGSSCSINISFVPVVSGEITGSIVIYDDANNVSYNVSLTGNSIVNNQPGVTPPDMTPPVDPNRSEIQFYHDFSNDAPGIYTLDDIRQNWSTSIETTSVSLQSGNETTQIVQDPNGTRGNVLSVFFKEGVSKYNVGENGKTADACCSGVQWATRLKPSDELYLAYDVMFEPGFDFSRGGKLPGLFGGPEFISGGEETTGYDGWSGRMKFEDNGRMTAYVYHAGKSGNYGQNFEWKNANGEPTQFIPGKWHTMEIRYVINTPGVADGVIQAWFDGQLALDAGKFLFRNTDAFSIDAFMLTTYFGGGWASPKNQYVYFDNFVVSTKPITH